MIFNKEHRRHKSETVLGTTLVLYEPSALRRCEFFEMGCRDLQAMPQGMDFTPNKDASPEELAQQAAATWAVSRANRKQTCFLIASCLEIGRDEAFADILAEIETLPDDALQALAVTAYELGNISLESDQGKE
ncbi:hypothetical protein NFHSH190041_36760 (plasmid) [Shewanella sp. NFH-SH190041]|uniref:hypothetical protein n=1 Tax=Shewanella sp. NFH-SH190041 TaxID=2950245 RepID=UPI0021C451E0|nr:hypothetical protein [Shewanella sp. NFH-SH190041]BDM66224.1 hypothetical protein NFHSH190041_36760 [Shewanella sp. NFH-SH190041]